MSHVHDALTCYTIFQFGYTIANNFLSYLEVFLCCYPIMKLGHVLAYFIVHVVQQSFEGASELLSSWLVIL